MIELWFPQLDSPDPSDADWLRYETIRNSASPVAELPREEYLEKTED